MHKGQIENEIEKLNLEFYSEVEKLQNIHIGKLRRLLGNDLDIRVHNYTTKRICEEIKKVSIKNIEVPIADYKKKIETRL